MRCTTGMMIFFAIFAALTSPALAAESHLLGTHGDWTAYVLIEDGSKVCYMASRPQKEEGNYTQRGEIFALVTHRPAEGTNNVFSYTTGYPYKSGSDANVAIGNKNFTLFTQDETAWAPDAETDNRLVQAIRAGSEMIVKGTSSRGTVTTDTFSLKGSAVAHAAISKECNVK
jgi:hypothetical protein